MSQLIDSVLSRLLDFRFLTPTNSNTKSETDYIQKHNQPLSASEIIQLCDLTILSLKKEESMLLLKAPITIVGDIHGQYYDLIRIFENNGYPGHRSYLFLGDYVDRGAQGVEVFCLLMCFKILCPTHFHLLRGNHESRYMNKTYGFYKECKKKFGDETVWNAITSVFDYLPFTALINGQIFCCHGGLSPEISSLDSLRQIQRPCEIPKHGLICDLVWSDPSSSKKVSKVDSSIREEEEDHKEEEEGFVVNQRLAGYNFNETITDKFMKKFDIKLIIRGHEVVENGYEFSFNAENDEEKDKNVITLFSAPNYLSKRGNRGAILNINEDLVCKFTLFNPINWQKLKYINEKTIV